MRKQWRVILSNSIYTVAQVNAYIRNMFATDFLLNRVSVRGEVSNCKYHSSGHVYFTIQDEQSALGCVMFSGDRKGLDFHMQNGDHIIVTGPVEVYLRDGRYQLYAKKIQKQGAGLLYERFLALKAELEEMGMFSPEYKQPVPALVQRLGVVTAPTGAAVQDIRNIALRRNPYVQIILYPALVQGEGAAASIAAGIRTLDSLGLDCIIVGRGGGSIEDLWAFNEETVARAIFEASTPVISAVGHETDTTIADYVADLRAPTPSAAAELAVADVREMLRHMDAYEKRLQTCMRNVLDRKKNYLDAGIRQWRYLSPWHQLREKRQRAADLEEHLRGRQAEILERDRQRTVQLRERMTQRTLRILETDRHRLELLIRTFDAASPIRKLNQGYAWIETEDHRHVAEAAGVKPGQMLRLLLRDGEVTAEAKSVRSRTGK